MALGTYYRWGRRAEAVLVHALLLATAAVLMVPFGWMALGAFAPAAELQRAVPMADAVASLPEAMGPAKGFRGWVAANWTVENFAADDGKSGLFDLTAMPAGEFWSAPVHGWAARMASAGEGMGLVRGGRLILWFENTLLVAGATTALNVLITALAGYAFARIPFPGREPVFWLLLASVMVPGQVTLIPLFLMFTRVLPLHDTFAGMILPQLAAPLGIFLMRQYMRGLPTALEEAARLDGCSEPGIWWRVILPLSKPVLAVWATFTFIGSWKGFLWPLVIVNDQNRTVLEVGLKTLQFSAGPRNMGLVMAAALLASVPLALMFFAFQRHLTTGLTAGGVKG